MNQSILHLFKQKKLNHIVLEIHTKYLHQTTKDIVAN